MKVIRVLFCVFFVMLALSPKALAQEIVNIPDPNFKAALVANTYNINTNGDSEIQVSEAQALDGAISVTNLGISDLTGIEAFTEIRWLYCYNNQLTSLDLSANTNLKTVWCYNNQLTSLVLNSPALNFLDCRQNQLAALDLSGWNNLVTLNCSNNQMGTLNVSNHVNLEELICTNNQLTSLTMTPSAGLTKLQCGNNLLTSLDVSANTNLATLHCYQNRLPSLDVSSHAKITDLRCHDNLLPTLDVSTNTNLVTLYCYKNQLGSLDVSVNTKLRNLWCNTNQLSSLSLRTNTVLTSLRCGFNQLSDLDLSANTSLTYMDSRNNLLASLNMRNGNYWDVTTFDARENAPGLCVKVDNVAYAESNWTNVDPGTTFSLYCGEVNVPDENFLSSLLSNPAINTDGDGRIMVAEAESFDGFLDVSGLSISDLTGIEAFTSLTGLDCSANGISKLSLDQNVSLTQLDCSQNQLTLLNIRNGGNSNFTSFSATSNPSLVCIEVDDVAYAQANWSDNVGPGAEFSIRCIVEIPDPDFKAALLSNPAINTSGDDEIQLAEAQAFTGSINVNSKGIDDLTGIETFTQLSSLNCNSNDLINLDVSANVALDTLDCYGNNLTDLRTGPGLLSLDCSSNSLTSIDLSLSTELRRYIGYWNQLSTIDISANTQLEILHIGINQLTSLDVSANTNLDYLHCGQNQLTALDVSANTALTTLFCNFNSISSFDISANPNLTFMVCNSNELTSLNLKNGSNVGLSDFSAIDNPDLECVQVDDVSRANALWQDNVDEGVVFDTNCSGETPLDAVYIPDPLFRQVLTGTPSINTNGDAYIQFSEAAAYSGIINAFSRQITDLTGIEAFTSLRGLNCGANDLTSLDVSANVALRTLECFNNPIQTLDVSQNPELTKLRCFGNELTALDVSANTKLTILECHNNQLTTLDVSSQPDLARLYCHVNQLGTLNLENNPKLRWLYCYTNQLNNLDLSNNPLMEIVRCNHNQLASLDVSSNPALMDVRCYANQLTALDMSANPALRTLMCFTNDLTSLNIRNGNNLQLSVFQAKNNQLDCIQVDDEAHATSQWSDDVDAGVIFSTDCSGAFRAAESDHTDKQYHITVLPNPSDGRFTISGLDQVSDLKVYSMDGKTHWVDFSGNELNISGLNDGVYFLRIRVGENLVLRKIIKQQN